MFLIRFLNVDSQGTVVKKYVNLDKSEITTLIASSSVKYVMLAVKETIEQEIETNLVTICHKNKSVLSSDAKWCCSKCMKLNKITESAYAAEYITLFLNLASASIFLFDRFELLKIIKNKVPNKKTINDVPDELLITILNEYIFFEKNHAIR